MIMKGENKEKKQAEMTVFFLGMLPGYIIALFYGIIIDNVKLMVVYGSLFGGIIGLVFCLIFIFKSSSKKVMKRLM